MESDLRPSQNLSQKKSNLIRFRPQLTESGKAVGQIVEVAVTTTSGLEFVFRRSEPPSYYQSAIYIIVLLDVFKKDQVVVVLYEDVDETVHRELLRFKPDRLRLRFERNL